VCPIGPPDVSSFTAPTPGRNAGASTMSRFSPICPRGEGAATIRIGSCCTAALLLATPLAAQRDTSLRAGRTILVAAIERRHAQVPDGARQSYHAAVKLAVYDTEIPADSIDAVATVSETRSEVDWRAPMQYHETILARRHTSKFTFVWNALSVVDIADFQRPRINIPPYDFVSPIADDAIDFYRFQLLGMRTVNGVRVYHLDILPRTPTTLAFTGTIDIAESTHDVVAMDLGVSVAADFGMWQNVRYRQHYADVGDGHWMPHDITLTADAHLPIKLPKLSRQMSLRQEAHLDNYHVETARPAFEDNEVRIDVARDADQYDNALRLEPPVIPETPGEQRVWMHRDSSAHRLSGRVSGVQRSVSMSQVEVASKDFFHFNRVDGAYAGAGLRWRASENVILDGKLGYAFGSTQWQYRAGGALQLSQPRRLWIGAGYHDETITRPSVVPHNSDRTIEALLYRRDPLDYYREQGSTFWLGIRPFTFTRLHLQYDDQLQGVLPVVTDYSLLTATQPQRPNGFIIGGRMRTLSGTFTYDSRSLEQKRGVETPLPVLVWTRITLSAEVSDPGLIASDFHFGRYAILLERHQRIRNSGVTTILALLGTTTGDVPPQRYFTLDFSVRALGFQGGGLKTLGDTAFAGTRVASLSIRHDFNGLIFKQSRIPLIRLLPFTLRVYSSAFATDFHNHVPLPGDSAFHTAPNGYVEAGFGLGNLLPFLSPLKLGTQFTWRLSNQTTPRFQFGFDLSGP
jgi:hypothetical protein